MIEKASFLKVSPSATPTPNLMLYIKALLTGNSLPKITIEKWNQADLNYFDPHFDKAYGEGEIVSIGKNIY